MARLPELEEFARVHDLKIISVADLIRYRMRKEVLVRRAAETDLPTVYGRFRAIAFENVVNNEVHLAMVMGDVQTNDPVLVRVHTENVTGDVFASIVDDTNYQLHTSLEKIAAEGRGVVLYLRQREHGLDLIHQLRTYELMQKRSLSLPELCRYQRPRRNRGLRRSPFQGSLPANSNSAFALTHTCVAGE